MTASDIRHVDARELKAWIHDEAELALLDVREHGQYGENHLFFAVPVPYSRLELDVGRLAPNPRTRTVIYGDAGSAQAVTASAEILAKLGYNNVYILRGGIEGWQEAGYTTFAGVNLPSKTFGELAEHAYGTPHISASELHRMLDDESQDVIVLDGRPVSEYRKMNIPGAICCPNGELALRVGELAPDPKTTIVINCAGRTRSIIGAQTLINLGVENKVYALENGTQGWYLSDYALEHQSDRTYPRDVDETVLPALRERSARLAQEFALCMTTGEEVLRWLRDGRQNVFVCDVRTEEEYRRDRLPAVVQHAPGGQLIQATDQYIGVRKAQVVLYDPDGIRAPVVGSWLKQMGWPVHLLQDLGPLADLPAPGSFHPTLQQIRILQPGALKAFLAAHPDALVLDARPSQDFRKLHLASSTWVVRPTLLDTVGTHTSQPILIVGTEMQKLELLAADLERAGCQDVYLTVLDAAGLETCSLPLAGGTDTLPDAACIDFLFFVHDRHDGNKEAARKYLEWETNLVAKLDEQEIDTFSFRH